MDNRCMIFIDDERDPPPGMWLVARTASAFEQLLATHSPTVISFDHDLGCDEEGVELPNGQHCARHLIDVALDSTGAFPELRTIILHSANPVGRANMRGLIENAIRHGVLAPLTLIELPVTSQPLGSWTPSDLAG